MTAGPLAALGRRLDHEFLDPALLERALTHASWANEHPPGPDNSALALVGDAVLALVVAEHLLAVTPEATVSVLTAGRAEVVSDANLARWGTALELGPLLRLGRGLDLTGGRELESVLATALEALLGALYLEAGLPATRRAVGRLAVW